MSESPTTEGVQGYERYVERFVQRSQSLKFEVVCRDFLAFLPAPRRPLLDAGAGAGQNAAALAEMGYDVTAVEPMTDFLNAARSTYADRRIHWLQDSLPALSRLGSDSAQFDFILVEAVWHHLDDSERTDALARLAFLLTDGGRCAISLRNGPPGLGSRVHPTDAAHTIALAEGVGLDCVLRKENLPSILDGKENVVWSRLVFQKHRPRPNAQTQPARVLVRRDVEEPS